MGLERIQLNLPEFAVYEQPLGRVAEWSRNQPTDVLAPLLLPLDQARVLEHRKVLGDGGQRDGERLGEDRERRLAQAEPFQNGAAGGIGECREDRVECRGGTLNHSVKR
jgi:hypothetical protein